MANGSVKPSPTNSVKLRKFKQVDAELPTLGPVPEDGGTVVNGVVLRALPKIRRPHYVASMPVIEKAPAPEENPRHSMCTPSLSEKLEEMLKKLDETATPSTPNVLRRTQSLRTDRMMKRLRNRTCAVEPATSPYKNYTFTTPRRHGIQKRKTLAKRRKSMVDGVNPEVLLRQVELLKERELNGTVKPRPEGKDRPDRAFPFLKSASTKSAK